jgi:hypothetical protein
MRSPIPQPALSAARDANHKFQTSQPKEHALEEALPSIAPPKKLLGGWAVAPHAAGFSMPVQRQVRTLGPRLHESVGGSGRAPGSACRVAKDELAPGDLSLAAPHGSLHLAFGSWAEQHVHARRRGWQVLRALCSGRRSPLAARPTSSRLCRSSSKNQLAATTSEQRVKASLIDDEKISLLIQVRDFQRPTGSGPGVRRAVLDTSATSPRLAAAGPRPGPELPGTGSPDGHEPLAARRASTSSRTSSRPKNRSASPTRTQGGPVGASWQVMAPPPAAAPTARTRSP